MVSGLIARVRSLWRGVRRGTSLDADMEAEFRFHMERRAADLVREGLTPAEAVRRARIEFGSVERYKDEGREQRGLAPFDGLRVSWLDFKLGFRMLVKYPGLTVVGGLAIAFAIGVGAAAFEFSAQFVRPALPLDEGDRIVAIRQWDARAGDVEERVLHDFARWRAGLRAAEDLGTYRSTSRNLIAADGPGEPVEVAEITASAFRLTRVPPLLGRPLVEADERPDAPTVVVLGYDVWRTRFAADSGVVGTTVRLGRTPATVVGVMPERYGFPVAHRLWMPLRIDPLHYPAGEGPALMGVFGRLAPGATLRDLQAELDADARRAAADAPATHAHRRPRAMPYARSVYDLHGDRGVLLWSTNVFLVMLVVLICSNVALLTFARAAARESEIVVRSALGASRRRIVMQLFSEALVLSGVGLALGLLAARAGVRWAVHLITGLQGRIPFWHHDSLSPTAVLYAVLLALLGAAVVGVLPGIKVTAGGLDARLRRVTAGGGGPRFGGVWTAVVVTQVAATVAFPVIAFLTLREGTQMREMPVPIPAHEFLAARLEMDRDSASPAVGDRTSAMHLMRFEDAYEELRRRLTSDPAVRGVTYASHLPRTFHHTYLVEVDAGGAAPLDPDYPAYRVSAVRVAPDYFDVLGAPPVAGRGFGPADAATARHLVVVSRSFVRRVLGGRNPLGRRLRYVYLWEAEPSRRRPGPWFEIVGVVPDLGTGQDDDPRSAGIYHPGPVSAAYPASIAVRVNGDPARFAPRLRAHAAAAEPTLRLSGMARLDQVDASELRVADYVFRVLLALSVVALALSLAGIYAVMSFAVARRTREIGVRVALGARRRDVVGAVFRQPLTQVSLGILGGAALAGVLLVLVYDGEDLTPLQGVLLVAYALLMLAVCLLACVAPTRRALAVQPTEALRAE